MSKYPKYLISILISLFFILIFYSLCLRLISQIHYYKAVNNIRDGYYGSAIEHLETAIHYQPNEYLFWEKLGKAYHNSGELKPVEEAFHFATKAKHAYLKSAYLNPIDSEAVFGLARGEARLEIISPYLQHQKDKSYNAFPYFQKSICLRPNGVLIHFAFVRYLYWQKKKELLLEVVSNMARIYPPVYNFVKKEEFWSQDVIMEALKNGLQQAIDERIDRRLAHMSMSFLLAGEKDWQGAIIHYQKALAYQEINNNSNNFFHLGRLYLENGQLEEAENFFFKAVSISRTREKDLEGLFWAYKKNSYSEELNSFYERISNSFALSSQMDILLVRSVIDLKQYNKAQRILKELNQKEPTAEAYYWLAIIAEKEKDLDRMELAIQKATVLDPENSRYHLIFSKVLKRLKKLERAEKEAGLAIKHSSEPSLRLYNKRAFIRMDLKDYQGAIEDWKTAIALNPYDAEYYVHLAEAYYKLGEWSFTLKNYQKAIDLDPKKEKYRKRYNALRAEHPDSTNPA
ncbi:MAG: tetratricopeptide repeat protein [Deltaproteobacteria bacterium]|jgi:tetratricopeptide (TPR) repeat protein|nr:tetratricopeptide repeat protein [Deltaproteobacteria bacterium]